MFANKKDSSTSQPLKKLPKLTALYSKVFFTKGAIRMAQRFTWRNLVAHNLFQFPDILETAIVFSREDKFIIGKYVEYTAAVIWPQAYFFDFGFKCGEQFLRYPHSAHHPSATGAVHDGNL
jgi:hypothetical protein